MSVLCAGTGAQYTTYLDYIKAYKGVTGSNFEGTVGTTVGITAGPVPHPCGMISWVKGDLPVAIRFNFER